MKKIASLFIVSFMLLLSGCNTVQGLGQDIQRGGQVLEEAVKKK